MINEGPKDIIHHGLENRWSIGEAKWHDEILEMPQVSVKRSLPLIPLPNADQMVGVAEVEFRKNNGTLQELKRGCQQREGVLVLDSYVI